MIHNLVDRVIDLTKSKRLTVILFVLAIILLSMSGINAEDSSRHKNILLLNSYNHGLAWTENETNGVLSVFKKSSEDASVFIEYMDWKNYPDEENIQLLSESLKYKYRNKKLDVIITTDDKALDYVLQDREKLFPGVPVVFCGVNDSGISKIVNGHENVTGVVEEIDPTETIRIAMSINPDLKNVYVLYDNSESGISTGNIVIDKIKSADNGLNIISLNNLSYDDLINNVKTYGSDSIILFTTYYGGADGRIVEYERAVREVSANSTVPVYHLYDFGMDDGGFGGNLISSELYGKKAAELAMRIIDGEKPENIPFQYIKATKNVFDYNQLLKFDIPLSHIPKDSEILNKPFSFLEKYRTLVIAISAAFIVLIAFVLVLLFYINRIKKIRENLAESHEELTQLYEELTASDEELQQQFDENMNFQKSLAKSEERFRIAADGSNAVIWDTDMDTNVYHFSDKWYALLGYEKGEIDEANFGWKKLIHPEDQKKADIARKEHLEGKTPFYDCEYRMKAKSGDYIWFNVRGKILRDSKGNNIRFAGSMIDVTERKEYERKLQDSYQELESTYEELTAVQEELSQKYDEILATHEKIKANEDRVIYMAYHDVLTNLPNKLALFENANKYLSCDQDRIVSVMYIDMDNLKYINDRMGHSFGDQVIISVSERISSLINEGSQFYRLDGDEFIVLNCAESAAEVEKLAQNIIDGFKAEICLEDSVIHTSLSIGIALCPEHGNSMLELMKYADIAMYKAKEEGRSTYVIYNEIMNEVFTEKMDIEKNLHKAIENNEFEIYYQPQLDLVSNAISGFEALLRWNSPELGFVSPLKFIKVAEDSHLIIPLGKWVFENACAFLSELHKQGYSNLTISINISILQLLQSDFNDMIINTLTHYDIKPQFVELEVTESVLMESFDTIGKKLELLRDMGVKVALDDFGKGYSSLNYLKQLPISTLKIDKSFIDCICSEENEVLTGQIVKIGMSMGMTVIAEGVEKKEQLEYLIQNGCHKIQGYIFSKPVPQAEVMKLLKIHI